MQSTAQSSNRTILIAVYARNDNLGLFQTLFYCRAELSCWKKTRLKHGSSTTFETKSCHCLVALPCYSSLARLCYCRSELNSYIINTYILLDGLVCSIVGYFNEIRVKISDTTHDTTH